MKTYTITKGYYDEFRIVDVTTDKERAEKIAEKFSNNGETAFITERDDDDYMLKSLYGVIFTPSHTDIKKITDDVAFNICRSNLGTERLNTCIARKWDGIHNYDLAVVVETDDEEYAMRIATEKKNEYLANKT